MPSCANEVMLHVGEHRIVVHERHVTDTFDSRQRNAGAEGLLARSK